MSGSPLSLTRGQKQVIWSVTFGNILEWFDIYSYAYLAPMIAKVFFNFDSALANLIGAFIIFGSGFISRPFGSIVFGRIGDLLGRRKAFIYSLFGVTGCTLCMGCLPTYATAGIYAPICLGLLRILQSIPASGEVPGAICFLYENSQVENRRFITSWTGVGNQIGAILGIAQSFLMDQFMSEDFLTSWGWRIVFWSGGFLGFFGIYLRSQLYETPVFKALKEHHRVDKQTFSTVIMNCKKKIGIGVAFGVVNAATFYLIATYLPTYFQDVLQLSPKVNTIIALTILTLTTVTLPFFGKLGDRICNKKIFIFCAIMIIALIYPLYASMDAYNLFWISLISVLYIIPITCISALLPYLLARLFSTSVRYTSISLSVNLSDGIIGGFTPAIALFLVEWTGNPAAFCWFILVCSIVSLLAYLRIKL